MALSFKYTRLSAFAQLLLGFLCIIFGIADRATMYSVYASFHSQSVAPIWMGVWFVATGIIGFTASRRQPNSDRPSGSLVGAYLGFSIVSIVFAGVIIIMYSLGITFILNGESCASKVQYSNGYTSLRLVNACNTSVGLASVIIIFAVIEFGVGLWACICCCAGGYNCCYQPELAQSQIQMGQIIYIQTQHGPAAYVMTQGANGVPVAVPAMTPGPVVMTPGQAPMQAHNQQGMIVHPTPTPQAAASPTPYTGTNANNLATGAGPDTTGAVAGGQQNYEGKAYKQQQAYLI